MSIWGVGDGGGTLSGVMLVQRVQGCFGNMCAWVCFRGVAGSGMGAGLSWGQW